MGKIQTPRLQIFRTRSRIPGTEPGFQFSLLLVLLIFASPIHASSDPLPPCPTEKLLPIYVTIRDAQGRPIRNLQLQDWKVFDEGHEQRILEYEEIEARASGTTRYFILFFDSNLTFRDLFRSKWLAKRLIQRFDPPRDQLAVIRGQAISEFTGDPEQMVKLVDFFGSQQDRYEMAPPTPKKAPQPDWLCNPDAGQQTNRETATPQGSDMLKKGYPGRFEEVVTRMKHLPGQKWLLLFAKSPPFQPEEPEFRNPGQAARLLGDAGVSPVLIGAPAVLEVDPDWMGWLREWIRASGGVEINGADKEAVVRAVLDRLSHSYYLAIRPPDLDNRFHRLSVALSQPAFTGYRPGYFATLGQHAHLRGRSFLTALASPRNTDDLNLILSLGKGEADGADARLTLLLPFRSVRLEVTEAPDGKRGYQQKIRFFIAAYNPSGEMIYHSESESLFNVPQNQFAKLLQMRSANARVEELIPLDSGESIQSVLAVVIVGQNQQIAAKWLTLDEPIR